MKRYCLVISLAFLGPMDNIQAQQNPPPKAGQRNDQYGNLRWKSTASQQPNHPGTWDYLRIVENKDQQRNLVFTWKNKEAVWTTTVEKGKTAENGISGSDLPPEEIKGLLYYRGGVAPKDGEAPGEAWFPKGTIKAAAKKITSHASVAFIHNDRFYPVEVHVETEIKPAGPKLTVSYHLKLTADKEPARLPEVVRVRWTAIEFRQLLSNTELFRFFKKLPVIVLKEKDSSFQATFLTTEGLVFRKGSVQLIHADGKQVFAESWMPTWGPRE